MIQSLRFQQGATLIVVMLSLLLITTLGVMSVRQSRTDLSIANSAEVQNILMQGSDNAMSKVEADVRKVGSTNVAHLVGFAYDDIKNTANNEVVVCFRPLTSKLLDKTKYSKIKAQGAHEVNRGSCNVSQDNDYANKRGVSVTQVAITSEVDIEPKTITKPNASGTGTTTTNNDKPVFQHDNNGTDTGNNVNNVRPITVHAITLVPAFSSASDSDINECLKNRLVNDYGDDSKEDALKIESVADCLDALGVPNKTQVQTYLVEFG